MMQQRKDLRRTARRRRDGGYLLLAIMLMMAFMVIAAAYIVGPSIVQQMKRDREEEMIHRGTEYARAIKKFYKKYGRYPSSLDDLDKGQIRFLRKRYQDPLTKDGKWKLLRYGDIQNVLAAAGPGTPAAALGQAGGGLTPGGGLQGGNSAFGSQQSIAVQQQQFQGPQFPGQQIGFPSNSDQGSNPEGVPTNNFGTGGATGGVTGGAQSGGNQGFSLNIGGSNQAGGASGTSSNQQGGTTFGQNATDNNQSFGGGAIVGVASLSKDPTIRVYNKKKKYNEWQFIYNPIMDQPNVLLRGPYQPTTIGNTNIGTPASQLGQQNNQQNSPFGQQNNGFGQSNGGFGQQPQQQQPLQNNFPPDQNQLQ